MIRHSVAASVLVGIALATAGCAPSPTLESASGCSRSPAEAFPDTLPAAVPVVVMQAPVAASRVSVVMAATWASDHWSDRTAYLVGPGNPPARIRARDLSGLPRATQVAYRAVFDCTQVAVSDDIPWA